MDLNKCFSKRISKCKRFQSYINVLYIPYRFLRLLRKNIQIMFYAFYPNLDKASITQNDVFDRLLNWIFKGFGLRQPLNF